MATDDDMLGAIKLLQTCAVETHAGADRLCGCWMSQASPLASSMSGLGSHDGPATHMWTCRRSTCLTKKEQCSPGLSPCHTPPSFSGTFRLRLRAKTDKNTYTHTYAKRQVNKQTTWSQADILPKAAKRSSFNQSATGPRPVSPVQQHPYPNPYPSSPLHTFQTWPVHHSASLSA